MDDVASLMDSAHKLLAQSAGSLSLQIVRKKVQPGELIVIVARVERAGGLLRKLAAMMPAENGSGDDQQGTAGTDRKVGRAAANGRRRPEPKPRSNNRD